MLKWITLLISLISLSLPTQSLASSTKTPQAIKSKSQKQGDKEGSQQGDEDDGEEEDEQQDDADERTVIYPS